MIRELNARAESLLPFLYTQLKGPKAQVSKAADSIRGLGMMGAVHLAKGLLEPAIKSAHKYILRGGLSWLGPRAIKAMPWLKKALAHKDPKIVFAALYALSSMGHWAMLAEPQLQAFATRGRSPHQAYALMILLPHTHKLSALLPKAVSLSHVLVQRPEFASKVKPSTDARIFLVEVMQALFKIAPSTRALGLLEATLHRTRTQAHPALRGWLIDRFTAELGKHSAKAPVMPILSTFVARIAAQKDTRWQKGLDTLFMEPPPSFLPSLRKLLPYLRRVARSKAKERHLAWAPLLLLEGQKASTRDAIIPLIASLSSYRRKSLWFRLFVYAKKHSHIRKLLIAQLKSGTQQRRAAMLSAAHLMRGDWRPAFPAIWSFLRRSKQRPSLYARHLVARVLLKLRWPARWDAAQVLPLLRDPNLQVRAAAAAFVSRSPHHKAAAMAVIQQVLSSPETSSYLNSLWARNPASLGAG